MDERGARNDDADRARHRAHVGDRRGRPARRRARLLDLAHHPAPLGRRRTGARHDGDEGRADRHRPRHGPRRLRRVRDGVGPEARVERVRVDGRTQPRDRAARDVRGAAIDRQGIAAATSRSARCARENAKGANIVAQIALRGNGIVMAWRGTVHPFRFRPAWLEIMELPWDEQLAAAQGSRVQAAHDHRGEPVSRRAI